MPEGKFFAASALGVQANWPNLAFGGRRCSLAVSGGWWRTPAGAAALWGEQLATDAAA